MMDRLPFQILEARFFLELGSVAAARSPILFRTGAGHRQLPLTSFKARILRNDVKTSIKFILGEQSNAMFQRSMKQLTNIFPQAPLIKIPNGNHLAHIDQPEEFIKAVRDAVRH